jgi:hypothetical protein
MTRAKVKMIKRMSIETLLESVADGTGVAGRV